MTKKPTIVNCPVSVLDELMLIKNNEIKSEWYSAAVYTCYTVRF